MYALNDILESEGHEVLRLLDYHTDLNPFKLIRAEVTGFVIRQIISFNLNEVKRVCDVQKELSSFCTVQNSTCLLYTSRCV